MSLYSNGASVEHIGKKEGNININVCDAAGVATGSLDHCHLWGKMLHVMREDILHLFWMTYSADIFVSELWQWNEEAPQTYQSILKADIQICAKHSGRGSW